MPNDRAQKDDPVLAALIKSLDDAHDDLIANGPVSADQLDRDIQAYDRHRRDIEEEAAKARPKVG